VETAGLETALVGAFLARHPQEACRHLERLPAADSAALLEEVDDPSAAGVLERMAPLELAACLQAMPAERAGPLLGHMDLDAAAGALRRVEGAAHEAILASAPPATSEHLRRLLAYPPGTAGALMEPRVWSAAEESEVGQALAAARRMRPELATCLDGVERQQRLVGVAGLDDLVRADPRALLSALLGRDVAQVRATASGEALLEHPAWRDHRVLPVVDDAGRLLGAVRWRSIRETARPASPEARLPASAFGELYWIGFTGMLSGLVAAFSRPTTVEPSEDQS